MIISKVITEKAILAFNSTLFVETEPVFNLDIGYYIFRKPFIEAILYSVTKYHSWNPESTKGYDDGWKIKIF